MTRRSVGAVALGLLFLTLAASAQEPILVFSLSPRPAQGISGGQTDFTVRVANESLREADDVEVAWIGADGLSLDPVPSPIAVVAAFQTVTIPVILRAEEGLPAGEYEGQFEFVYTYCIDELCFQIIAEEDVSVVIRDREPGGAEAGVESITSPPAAEHGSGGGIPWRWIAFGLACGVTGLFGSAVLRRTRRLQGLAAVILVLIVGGSLFYGVSENQHEQAQAIGAVLCTSCVGIEDARTERPGLTESQIAVIEAIDVPIELIVFYAPWCHACPFAEELVERVAGLNARISYRFVNVEEDSTLAESYGVIRSGRTVVPATVRPDNGAVLFGVENLERRLVEMLRAEP